MSTMLYEPLTLPVEVIEVDGLPKIMSGNLPVTPLNIALKLKRDNRGATKSSLDTYARAGRLYVEFVAHRRKSPVDITNEEFQWFAQALQGHPFMDADRRQVVLSGSRGPRTADLMVTLLYSLAAEIQEIYNLRLDWYRYRGASPELVELVRALGGRSRAKWFRRTHRVPYTPRKIMGLPDHEFERLLLAARARWGDRVVDGDRRFAEDPEAQRGALFFRNAAILLAMRFEGSRRSETPLIRLGDIDRSNSRIYLTTKGHGGEHGERLPVLLHPLVEKAIWIYVTKYQPVTEKNSTGNPVVFVSHSTRNYGAPISAQTVRKVIEALRDQLTSPWDKLTTPHTLRHRYAVDLQKHVGEAGTIVNMRHASSRSLDSYMGSPEDFAEELVASADERLVTTLADLGLV